jgi:hypothetical protein
MLRREGAFARSRLATRPSARVVSPVVSQTREGSDSLDAIEATLAEALVCIRAVGTSAAAEGLRVETMRLQTIVSAWRAAPPSSTVRREMFARAKDLAARAGSRPPDSDPTISSAQEDTDRSGPPRMELPLVPSPEPEVRARPAQPGRPPPKMTLPSQRAAVLPSPAAPHAPGPAMVRTSQLVFSILPAAPGVRVAPIQRDGSKLVAALISLRAGSRLPAFLHYKQLFVLEGTGTLGSHAMIKGDFVNIASAPPPILESAAGCTVLALEVEGLTDPDP